MTTPYRQPGGTSSVETNTMAVIAIVGGAASWIGFPIIGAIVGIVCGHIARGQIRRDGGSKSDYQVATIGMWLGYAHMLVACVVVGIVLLMVAGAIGTAAMQAH